MMANDQSLDGANDHSLDGATIPAEIVANLKEFLPEFGDLNHEELLQHQECVFQSLKGYGKNEAKMPGGSSRRGSFDQLALDEAFARSLQMEDDFDYVDLSHSSSSSHSATPNEVTEVRARETPHTPRNHDLEQDDVDPDYMSYEELQSLGEAIGSESQGLPEKVISRLSKFKYRTGAFSKKKEKEECAICRMDFENGDKLISLPCDHKYHSKCIRRWLQQKKNCPLCFKEVSAV